MKVSSVLCDPRLLLSSTPPAHCQCPVNNNAPRKEESEGRKQRDQKCRQRLFRPWQRGKGREEDSGTLELGAAETLRESFLSLPLRLEFFSPLVLHGSLKSHKSPRHQNRELRGVSRSLCPPAESSLLPRCVRSLVQVEVAAAHSFPHFFAPRKSESGKLPPKYRLSSRTKKEECLLPAGPFRNAVLSLPPLFFALLPFC